MTVVFVVVGLLFLVGVGLLAVGRLGQLNDSVRDQAPEPVLAADPGPADFESLRFTIAARGYRMAEVDDALRSLSASLAERDQLIAQLRGQQQVEDVESPANQPPVAESTQ